MTAKQTRNRSKRPPTTWGNFSAAEWRATTQLVNWAQTASEYRYLITLLVNDKQSVLETLAQPATENCLLGRHQAYDALIGHLKTLAEGAKPPVPGPAEPDYTPPHAPDDPTTVNSDFLDSDH